MPIFAIFLFIFILNETFTEMRIIYVINIYLGYANYYTVQVNRVFGKCLKQSVQEYSSSFPQWMMGDEMNQSLGMLVYSAGLMGRSCEAEIRPAILK